MYIAHIVSHLRTGGAEKLVAEISNRMCAQGIKVKVISILRGRGIPYEILNKEEIEVIELNYDSTKNPRIPLDLFQHTKDCDLIHTHTFYAQLYASFFIQKEKLLTTEHSTSNNRRGKIVFKPLDYLMYRKYRKIVCISEDTEISLSQWQPTTKEKTMVIHNGIEVEKFLEATPLKIDQQPNSFILTCVARFSKLKNHKNLIEAMRLTSNDIQLILVGTGETQQEIKNLVHQYQLEHRAHFFNQRNDIERILKSSDMFVLPSLWEGFGLSAVEALATGTPIAVSDVGGLNKLIENDDCGVLFDPTDPFSISSKIEELRDRLKNDAQLPNRCIKKALRFDIKYTVHQYIELYEQLLDSRG